MNKNIQMRRKVLPLHVFTHTPSFICADNVAPCRSRKVSGPQPGRNGQSEEVVASKLRLVDQFVGCAATSIAHRSIAPPLDLLG